MRTRSHSDSFIDNFPGTAGLIMVISAFFVLEVVGHTKHPNREQFDIVWSVHPQVVSTLGSNALNGLLDLEVWRLFASMFLHGGILHLAMNTWVLLNLGRTCEPMLGTERFLATYFATGLIASLTSAGRYYWLSIQPPHPMDPNRHMLEATLNIGSVGASGALAGLIGLLLGFSLRHRDTHLRNQILMNVVFIIVITFSMSRVDHSAHLGGFLAGIAFGVFVPRYTASSSVKVWRSPCWILCALAAVSLGFAVWNHFRP